jgi:uncharacterized coiled-coil protein SlyX
MFESETYEERCWKAEAENARLREELSDREDDIRTEQLWVTHWKEELDCTKDILEQTRTQLATVTNKFEMSEAIVAGDGALITGLKNDLAAAQATIEQMREALESKVSISEVLMEAHEDSCRIHDDAMFCTCGAYDAIRINKAIAIPTNLDALHEARALECERLKNRYRENSPCSWWLDEEAAAHRARKEGK